MDNYKFAAMNRLRFSSVRGELTVEDLFGMVLKNTVQIGYDLNTVAKTINTALKDKGEESFVEDNSADPAKKSLEIALEIVKDVIKTKQEANAARTLKADKAAKRTKILDALAAKENEALTTATVDELKKQLEELEA